MAIGTAPCAAAARPRLHSCRAAAPHMARQNAGGRRPAVSAAAAAPRAGGDSPTRNTTAAAAVFTADFAVSCPWPRPPSYQEPSPPASEQRLSIGSRLAIVVAKLMNGDTGALPPAVARLGGAFTDGCAVDGVEDSVGATSSSSRASSQNPLLRAAARLWRYQGLR